MRQVDLGWMRVFVEAVRLGSLTEAAQALRLTQPAVSYQIRRAEAEFGTALLHRQHRGVAPTEAGARLYDILSRSVAQVDALALRLRDGQAPAALRLYTDYAFSGLWLIPRLQGFRAAHPGLDLQIIAAQQTDLARLAPGDTAVVFGARGDFGPEAALLMPETVAPVCAPALAGADPARARLIHLDSPGGARWFDWAGYLARIAGGADGGGPDGPFHQTPMQGSGGDLRLNTYSLVIEAALAGQGVALGWHGLIDAALGRGTLVETGPRLTARDRGYFIVQPAPQSPGAETLRHWLLAELPGAGPR